MDKISKLLRNLSKTDLTAIAVLSVSFIFLIWQAFFDGTISDEAFYITIPMRLINGDGMFTDEWHLSQLSSVLLYPFIKIFLSVTKGTKGIILYVRLLFVLMQISTGAVLYKTLRKHSVAAILISASFSVFSIIGLNTLSYNTMGLATLILLLCTIYSVTEAPSSIKMFLCGSFVAMFILCQPVGLVFYGVYFVAVCVFFAKSRKSTEKPPYPFTLRSFFMTVAGILPVLIFFLYLLIKNSDFRTIFECIPGILSDVEHMEITEELGINTFSFIQYFIDMTMSAGIIPIIILLLCTVAALLLKKKNKNISVFIILSGLTVFVFVYIFRLLFMNGTTETDDINFFFLPFALVGIAVYLLREKKNHKTFILFWCTGIAYALMMTISSNLRLHASVNGYIIASMGTILLAKDLYHELSDTCSTKQNNKINKNTDNTKVTKAAATALICIIFGFSAISSVAIAANQIFQRKDYKSIRLTEGIYAGISLPSDQAVAYTNIRKDAERINAIISEDDRVFVCENIPTMYLEGNFNIGAFSAWFIQEQLSFPEIRDRFREYYEILPENIPDYVYVPAYIYSEYGIDYVSPKKVLDFPLALFDGEVEDIGSGLLIKVTGIKNEQS